MKTTIKFLSLILVIGLSSGCGGVQTSTPTVPQPTSTAAVIHNTLSIILDPALGSDYQSMTIAEYANPDKGYSEIHPEYNELDIRGYPLSGTALEPRIYLFPVVRYRQLSPEIVPAREADLQSLLTGGPIGADEMPLLPLFNSKQMFTAQVKMIEFQNGKGIRYITQYAQGIVPINNQEMFYTFQGLTADNQYWVSVILPISNPLLPSDGKNPPDGKSMDDFAKDYLKYISDTTAQLNAQNGGSFTPSIAALDALVGSIVVQP